MKIQSSFVTAGRVVMRTPMWPYEKVKLLSREELVRSLDNPYFCEALWLASPVLFEEAMKWKHRELNEKETRKVIISLAKYYQRLCTRATPFGLFASCTILPIKNSCDIGLADSFNRSTRLDANYIFKLILSLEKDTEIRKKLHYSCNTSMYNVKDKKRYHEFDYIKNHKRYSIVDVDTDEYLERILSLCKYQKVPYSLLIQTLLSEEVAEEDAQTYINELIDSQIIVSNLEPTILKDDLLNDLIEELSSIDDSRIYNVRCLLTEIRDDIALLDKNKINDISAYAAIVEKIRLLNVDFDLSKLFQVDVYRPAGNDSSIADADINALLEITSAISYLFDSAKTNTGNLTAFAQKFSERYETESVPLTLVLDSDTGLGYPIAKSNLSDTPLIDDFGISKGNTVPELKLDRVDQFLLELLIQNAKTNQYTIKLEDYIGDRGVVDQENRFEQPSINVIFNKVMLDGKPVLLYQSAGGTSSIDYFGRFAHTDQLMFDLIQGIAKHEEDAYADAILADIVHFPEMARLANISLRPSLHPYQIPYLAKGIAGKESIPIDDIDISVINGKIWLRSRKIGKYIIPRLSNAHNYSSSKIPIYHFLCDVQNQSNHKYVGFNWKSAAALFKFFPRVVYKEAIVSAATWHMSADDVAHILSAIKGQADTVPDLVLKWRAQFQIPEEIVLSKGDNELYVNFSNEISTITFFDEIKKSASFIIKEFFLSCEMLSNGHCNQFVLPLLNKQAAYSAAPVHLADELMPKRKFTPGNHVLYFKIYGGHKMLEKILLEQLYPKLQHLQNTKEIRQWFFIRYSDPDYHLRLRIFLDDENAHSIITTINSILDCDINDNVLTKVSLDTYSRELERYGSRFIDHSELFFCVDSVSTVSILNYIKFQPDTETSRWLSAILNLDYIFQAAGLQLTERHEVMKQIRDNYFREFNGSKQLSDMLSMKYRNYKQMIEKALQRENVSDSIAGMHIIYQQRSERIEPILQSIYRADSKLLIRLLPSFIHMTLNRLFLCDPNKHELVIYDLLERFYKSKMAREKKQAKVLADE